MAGRTKNPSLGKRAFVEALGVFIFVILGAGSVVAAQYAGLGSTGLIVIALGNGIGLALAISFAMNISGGHINPAVSIAAWVKGLISGREAVVYIIAQVIGAILAGLVLVALYPASAGVPVHYGAPALGSGVTVVQGILFEALMTFFLVMMVMGTIVDRRAPKMAGFGVGLVVMLDVFIGGSFTGAAMNPARAIGPAIAAGFLNNWYVYWIGPIVGGIVAALVYKYLVE
jgi:MIP family channel proteins